MTTTQRAALPFTSPESGSELPGDTASSACAIPDTTPPRARGGEAHFLHVVAREELDPRDAPQLVVDPEDPRVERPLVPATIDGYRAHFAEWRAELAHRMRAEGVAYHEVCDDAAVESVVRRIVTPPGADGRR